MVRNIFIVCALCIVAVACAKRGEPQKKPAFENVQYCNYFDEFTMSPIGLADESGETTVDNKGDNIVVTDCISNFQMRYIKTTDGYVASSCFDMDRKELLKDGRYPRHYLRWILTDTVIEYERFYLPDKTIAAELIFIKTKDKLTVINSGPPSHAEVDSIEAFKYVASVINTYKHALKKLNDVNHEVHGFSLGYPLETGYLELERTKYNSKPAYLATTQKDSLYFVSPSESLFHITPGLEPEYMKEIRIKRDTEPAIDGVYSIVHVDQPPVIHGKTLEQYIDDYIKEHQNRYEGLSKKVVVLNVVITTSGAVEKTSIARSVGVREDSLAMDIVKRLPLMTPAKRNGKHVTVKMTVPVRFHNK